VRLCFLLLFVLCAGPLMGFQVVFRNNENCVYHVYVKRGLFPQETFTVPAYTWYTSPNNWFCLGGEVFTVYVYDSTFTLVYTSSAATSSGVSNEITMVTMNPTASGSTNAYSTMSSWRSLYYIAEYFMYGFTFMALLELGGMAVRMFRSLGVRHPSGDI